MTPVEIRAAEERAEGLLRGYLDEKQRNDWTEHGYFDVEVVGLWHSPRRFRIQRNYAPADYTSGGLYPDASYCIHLQEYAYVPSADLALAFKLMLEARPRSFVRIANRFP